MITLEFMPTQGEPRVIATVETEKEARQEVQKFLAKNEYISYYTRSWTEKSGWTILDVGSHTEFFRYKEVTDG